MELLNLRYPYNNFPPSIDYVGQSVALEIIQRKVTHALLLTPEMKELLTSDA
jgi:hypothetical protein